MISRYQMKSDTEILVLYLISALLSNMTTRGVVFLLTHHYLNVHKNMNFQRDTK